MGVIGLSHVLVEQEGFVQHFGEIARRASAGLVKYEVDSFGLSHVRCVTGPYRAHGNTCPCVVLGHRCRVARTVR